MDVDHGGGVVTRYQHLDEVHVVSGQDIEPGGVVGTMGTSGSSTGVHLHFEVLINGSPVNPGQFFPAMK